MKTFPVVETDFLLGLRKGDEKHRWSASILELVRTKKAEDLAVCGSAFVEIGIGLRGRVSRPDTIEVMRNLRALTNLIQEIPLSGSILTSALELEERLSVSNLFDCLHAATAISHDAVIVSDDAFYEQVPGLRRLSLKGFTKKP